MKADAILLSSGFSRRFGENKLLLPLGKKPLYRHILDTVSSCPIFESIFIVSGHSEILENTSGCIPIKNTESKKGISSSVKLGAQCSNACYLMFFVCDAPLLSRETILDFYESFLASKKGMGFISNGNTFGIPAIFSAKYKPEIALLSGDKGAKVLAERHWEDVFLYQIKDPCELTDCDTKEDFALIKSIYESQNKDI